MKGKTQLAKVNAPLERLNEIDNVFRSLGLVEWKAESKGGQRILQGKTSDGQKIRMSSYDNHGFNERTISSCNLLSPERRREEAKRLYKNGRGLTQGQIAERLGVSQKTVSNDVNS